MIQADGALLAICRGKVVEKGKAEFPDGKGGVDVSFRIVILFMGGKRTLYFDSAVDLAACKVSVGDRVDAIGEAVEGKGGKVYMRNVQWFKEGSLSNGLDKLFAQMAT